MPSTNGQPTSNRMKWVLAAASLLLPVIGVGLALYGAFRAFEGHGIGWLWLFTGIVVLIVDLVIDTIRDRRAKPNTPDAE